MASITCCSLSTSCILLLIATFFLQSRVLAVEQPTTTTHAPGDFGGDACADDSQCLNGAVCAEPGAHHPHKYCHCATGYAGIHCGSFCPLDCQNGGYCRYQLMQEPRQFQQDREPNDYFCQCFGLFEGTTCDIPYVNCGDGKKCYNGATCNFENVYKDGITTPVSSCECPRGWRGETCQDRVVYKEEGYLTNGRTKKIIIAIFVVAALTSCCWYSFVWLCGEDTHNVAYESVGGRHATTSIAPIRDSSSTASWRNVV